MGTATSSSTKRDSSTRVAGLWRRAGPRPRQPHLRPAHRRRTSVSASSPHGWASPSRSAPASTKVVAPATASTHSPGLPLHWAGTWSCRSPRSSPPRSRRRPSRLTGGVTHSAASGADRFGHRRRELPVPDRQARASVRSQSCSPANCSSIGGLASAYPTAPTTKAIGGSARSTVLVMPV